MMQFFAGAGGFGVVAMLGLAMFRWLDRDGLLRLMAGFVAIGHSDKTRRKDARQVLLDTRAPDPRTAAVPRAKRPAGSKHPGRHDIRARSGATCRTPSGTSRPKQSGGSVRRSRRAAAPR